LLWYWKGILIIQEVIEIWRRGKIIEIWRRGKRIEGIKK
jgi:hypothetical protein